MITLISESESWSQIAFNTFTMGLDNGVVLRTNLEVDYPHKSWDWRIDCQEHELCYWRKF